MLPPLMRDPASDVPTNQLGVPYAKIKAYDDAYVEGFCVSHCPDPQCEGGPRIWNDLAAD